MITDRNPVFQLKASFAPCTILQLTSYDVDQLREQLITTIQRAPNFFLGSPVVLDLEKIKQLGPLHFDKIKEILLQQGLVPMGIRGGSEEQQVAALAAGLPQVAAGKTTFSEAPKKTVENPPIITAKLVTTPVRSGMQVYAKDADLIVLSTVSVGAELLADGNIHVYGALRGRALAGVQGNEQARIFCHHLDAELVSIAGFYLTKEEIQDYKNAQDVVQIYLDNEKVKVAKLI